jgi:hypothetical protein
MRTTISGSPASHGMWSPASADPLAQSLAGINTEDLRHYMPDHDITRQLADLGDDCDLPLDEPFFLQSGASSQRSGRSGRTRRSERTELYSDGLDVSSGHGVRLADTPTSYGNGNGNGNGNGIGISNSNGSLSSNVNRNAISHNASGNGASQLAVRGHAEDRASAGGRLGRSPSREDHSAQPRYQRSPSPAHTRTASQRNGNPSGNTAPRTSNSLRGGINLESHVPASYHTMDMGGLSMSLLRSSHGSSQAPSLASPMRPSDSAPAVPVAVPFSPAASHGSGGILDIMNSMLADSYHSASATSSARKGRNETSTTATRAHDMSRHTADTSPPFSPQHSTAAATETEPAWRQPKNGSPASASFPRLPNIADGTLSWRSPGYEVRGDEVFARAAGENADASVMLESVKRRGSFEEILSEDDDDDLDIEDAAALSQWKPNLGQSRTDSNLSLQALRDLEAHGATSMPPGIVIQHVSPRVSTSHSPTLEEGYPGPVPIFRLDAPPEEAPWQRRLSAEQVDRAVRQRPGAMDDAMLSIPLEDDGDYEDPMLFRQRSGTPLAVVDDGSEDESVSNTSTPSVRISAGEVKASPNIKTPVAQVSPNLEADAPASNATPTLRRQSLSAAREEAKAAPPKIRIHETLGRQRTMSLQTSMQTSMQSTFDLDREIKLSPKSRRNPAVAPVAR